MFTMLTLNLFLLADPSRS